jgi:hypothetical protein
LQLGPDDIIRRGDDVGKRTHASQVVPDASERADIGHRTVSEVVRMGWRIPRRSIVAA